jgi:anti-sigma factor RsiW
MSRTDRQAYALRALAKAALTMRGIGARRFTPGFIYSCRFVDFAARRRRIDQSVSIAPTSASATTVPSTLASP